MKNYTKGIILVLISALAFSFLPIFIVFAYEGGIDTSTLLIIRFLTASAIFFGYLKLTGQNIKLIKDDLFKFFLLGVFGYTLQSRFFFSALHYVTPAIASMFLYTYPILVSIITYFIDKEKPTARLIQAIAISTIGLVMIMGLSMGAVNFIGVGFALLASLVYSVYIVSSNRLIKRISPVLASSYIALFSALGTLILATFTGGFNFNFAPSAWIYAFLIAIICSVVAMITFFKGMEYIGPTKTSIISLMEAVFTVVLSAVILQQYLTLWQVIGGMGVLFGAYLVAKA